MADIYIILSEKEGMDPSCLSLLCVGFTPRNWK